MNTIAFSNRLKRMLRVDFRRMFTLPFLNMMLPLITSTAATANIKRNCHTMLELQ